MYKKQIELLTRKNIEMKKGLSYDEIKKIEEIYQISFPKSYREFLMQSLPVSKGFYNWGDFSVENVEYIKKVIDFPKEALFTQIMDVTWCKAWGEEPRDDTKYVEMIKERLAKAPTLLPVFAHRYMPAVSEENPPVLSVHGADIIYYGENLSDYLEVEFGEKKQSCIVVERIKPVGFWSEIM